MTKASILYNFAIPLGDTTGERLDRKVKSYYKKLYFMLRKAGGQ